jgi:sorting nexin-8
MATVAWALPRVPVPCTRARRGDTRRSTGRRRPLRVAASTATAASEAAPSSSSDNDDFSWRLLEGANIHARREHARVALWPSTGDRARPPPPKRSFLDIDEVETFARDHGIKKNTLRLCYRELFRRGQSSFEHTPDVSARDMKLLKENFTVCTSEVVETKTTEDGSGAKMVVKLHDGKLIETVVIGHSRSKDGDEGAQAASDGGDVEKDGKVFRNTVCVSSQVGCAMGCTFCETGTLGLLANLTAGEICEQVWHARNLCGKTGVRNVVMMGMGEPLDNYEEVLIALRAMTHQAVFDMRQRSVTVSTVGVPSSIRKLADDAPNVGLALSLHAPTQELRARLLPSASGTAHTLGRLSESLKYHRRQSGRGAMIEYIVIDGVNDSPLHARDLGELVGRTLLQDDDGDSDVAGSNLNPNPTPKGRRRREQSGYFVNLIPYNPTDVGSTHGYESPADEALERMATILTEEYGVKAKVRWSTRRGREVDGACGQLALKSMRKEEEEESVA